MDQQVNQQLDQQVNQQLDQQLLLLKDQYQKLLVDIDELNSVNRDMSVARFNLGQSKVSSDVYLAAKTRYETAFDSNYRNVADFIRQGQQFRDDLNSNCTWPTTQRQVEFDNWWTQVREELADYCLLSS